jgi:hypothetical protein
LSDRAAGRGQFLAGPAAVKANVGFHIALRCEADPSPESLNRNLTRVIHRSSPFRDRNRCFLAASSVPTLRAQRRIRLHASTLVI